MFDKHMLSGCLTLNFVELSRVWVMSMMAKHIILKIGIPTSDATPTILVMYLCWLILNIFVSLLIDSWHRVSLLIDSGHLCTFVDWLCPRHRRIISLGIVPPRVWGNPAEVQLPPPSFQSKVLQHNVGQIQSNFCLLCDREMLQKAWLTQSQFRIWMVFNFLLSEMCKTHCSALNNGRECSRFPCRVCLFF